MSISVYQRYADELLSRAKSAAAAFKSYDQVQVDHIVNAVFKAAFNARIDLARLTFEETGIGILKHKIIKNCWGSLLVYENIKNQKTVGEISYNESLGITEIAEPRGPLLGMTPLTNPTSTTIFKVLIAMKTRNPIFFSAHGSARKSSTRAAEILYEAARDAGAPQFCIQWITKRHIDYLHQIMSHRSLALIIATGTRRIVKQAYLSGKPVIGIGPGNVPAFVDRTGDLALAADYIVLSKTFDNGTVCASEQALIVEKEVGRKLRPLLEEKGSYFCSPDQVKKLGKAAFDSAHKLMKADIVGQPPEFIAKKAGIQIPEGTKLLIAPCLGVGPGFPLSYEILAPILTYYEVDSYEDALNTCQQINTLGGQGHTISIYTNNEKVLQDFTKHVSAGRICVNTPATHGAIGGIYNSLTPSLTLSCGTEAGNLFTDNITTTHLLNIHRVARKRPNPRWFSISSEQWADPSIDADTIQELYNKNY